LNDQETWEERGTPIDHSVGGIFSFIALKDQTLGVRDARGLLNVRKQLGSEEIREVKVSWVDSNPDSSATSI